jgi:hypothetical protein
MIFLKLKHWQVFLLAMLPAIVNLLDVIVPILGETFYMSKPSRYVGLPVTIFSFVFVQLWIFFIVTRLREKIPEALRPNLTAYYIFLALVILNRIALFAYHKIFPPTISALDSYIIYSALLSLWTILISIYNMYVAGRTLVLAEKQHDVSFVESQGTAVSFIFYVVGVWWLQPRINRLVNGEQAPVEPGGPIDQEL